MSGEFIFQGNKEHGVVRRKIIGGCLKISCGSSGRMYLLCTSVMCLCWRWTWASAAPGPHCGLKSHKDRPQKTPGMESIGITIVGRRREESFESAQDTESETSETPRPS